MTKEEAIKEMIHHASYGRSDTTLDLVRGLKNTNFYDTQIRYNGSTIMLGESYDCIFSVEGGAVLDDFEYSHGDLTDEDWASKQSGRLIDDDALDALKCELSEL